MKRGRGRPTGGRAERARAPADEMILLVRHFPRALAAELRALAALRRTRMHLLITEAVRAYLDRVPDWRAVRAATPAIGRSEHPRRR